MKQFIHHMRSLLRYYTRPVVLHILGLAAAFVVIIAMSGEILYSVRYNKHIGHSDEIFLVTYRQNDGVPLYRLCRPAISTIGKILEKDILGICTEEVSWNLRAWTANDKIFLDEASHGITADFFKVFGFEWVACDTCSFDRPDYFYLPESMARSVFHTTDLIGTQVYDGLRHCWTIGGVYRDFPENNTVKNCCYNMLHDYQESNYHSWRYYVFVRLKHPGDKERIEKLLNMHKDISQYAENFSLVSYRDLYHHPELNAEKHSPTDYETSPYLYGAICLLALLIAICGFTCFYQAFIPLRIPNLNTRRILGARRMRLRIFLMAEIILLFVIAWVVALGLTALIGKMHIGLVHTQVGLSAYPQVIPLSGILTLLTGFLTSLYPAWHATSFRLSTSLKGSFARSQQGLRLSRVMTSVQFTSAFIALIMTSGIIGQNFFMHHSDLGYQQSRVISADVSRISGMSDTYKKRLLNSVKALPEVENAALSNAYLSHDFESDMMRITLDDEKGNQYTFQAQAITQDFTATMGIHIIEGREPRPSKDGKWQAVINRTAAKTYPTLKVGTILPEDCTHSYEVVGICEDFHYSTLRDSVRPCILFNAEGTLWMNNTYVLNIRIAEDADAEQVLQKIQPIVNSYIGATDSDVQIQTERMGNLYETEMLTGKTVLYLAFAMMFITITGVLALTFLECSLRRKEIGVRKVLGAQPRQIMEMFLKRYGRALVCCFIAALPVGGVLVGYWLQNFVYHISPLHPLIYLPPFVVLSAVVLVTVYFNCRKATYEHPANSIRTE